MGYGGYVNLINGSPFDWTLNSQHSYQMPAWNWPTVRAGTSAKVYVEYGTSGNTRDDGGEAYYQVAGTPNQFHVQARKPSLTSYDITVTLDALSTTTDAQGATVDAGFRHDAAVNWMLSTDEAGQWWSNSAPAVDWMHQNLGSFGNRTLNQLCMPGAHDAGMTRYEAGTVGANFANTQTQYLDVYHQLLAGARYFDLRPVVSQGQWKAGHYSNLDGVWLGGNGQTLADIIAQLNQFTAQYKELVIVKLSHTLDTDNGYRDLSQDQWNQLFETLKALNHRRLASISDLGNQVLNNLIQEDAAVLVIAELPGGISLGDYGSQGFFTSDSLPTFDSYSNTHDAGTMESDQLQKLKDNRNLVGDTGARKDKFHLLSWTLTQQTEDVLNPDKAIMNLAVSVYDDLFFQAYNAFTPESFPNVLLVDALGIRDKPVLFPYEKPAAVGTSMDLAALAVAVNHGKAGRNSYITTGG